MNKIATAKYLPVCLLSITMLLQEMDGQVPAPLRLMKQVFVTTDAEGGSARPEVSATNNRIKVEDRG
ncbi:MAG: hypothetical protein FJ215_06150 [Ignavibacteria bacterium]|nr:hypothetical protein [Ignavibacteria bacterium]